MFVLSNNTKQTYIYSHDQSEAGQINTTSQTHVQATYTFPETEIAHVVPEMSKYEIHNETKEALYQALQRSPINPKTGRHVIAFTVFNKGMLDFALWNFCSMKLAGIPPNQHVFVATDEEAYASMKALNPQTVFFPSEFTREAVNVFKFLNYSEILKMKPVVAHQFLLWGAEVIQVDVDIVFLENPFEVFNDEDDLQIQSDSDVIVQYNISEPIPMKPNSGFYKFRPTPVVMKFFKEYLTKCFSNPKTREQHALSSILKAHPKKWIDINTFCMDYNNENMTIRYLDPLLISNAGGNRKDGKEIFANEARRRGVKRPKMVHFFHVGFIREKRSLIKDLNMSCVTADNQCKTEQPDGIKYFPWWK